MLSAWESVKLIAKINFFYLWLEWKNGHCSCVELVEYIPFDYLLVSLLVLEVFTHGNSGFSRRSD